MSERVQPVVDSDHDDVMLSRQIVAFIRDVLDRGAG